MEADQNTALDTMVVEVGLDVAGQSEFGPVIKELYRRSSHGKVAAEIAKIELEEEVAANLSSHVHSEVQRYLDELSQTKRAEQVGGAFEAAAPDERPTAADLVKIALSLAEKAEKSIDSKKRRLLAAAVMNSFDPVLYQLGMTEDLLKTLDDLTYADALVLKQLGGQNPPTFKDIQGQKPNAPGIGAVQKLVRLNLVEDGTQRHPRYVQLDYTITDRGRALLRLLAEEEIAD